MLMTFEENAACTRFCNCVLDMIQRYGGEVQEESKLSQEEARASSEGKRKAA